MFKLETREVSYLWNDYGCINSKLPRMNECFPSRSRVLLIVQ